MLKSHFWISRLISLWNLLVWLGMRCIFSTFEWIASQQHLLQHHDENILFVKDERKRELEPWVRDVTSLTPIIHDDSCRFISSRGLFASFRNLNPTFCIAILIFIYANYCWFKCCDFSWLSRDPLCWWNKSFSFASTVLSLKTDIDPLVLNKNMQVLNFRDHWQTRTIFHLEPRLAITPT